MEHIMLKSDVELNYITKGKRRKRTDQLQELY